jgi:hypothetical protein
MATNFEDLVMRGDTASKPEAGVPGRLYFDTTVSKLYRDNGATWDEAEGEGSAAPGGGVDILTVQVFS